MLGVLVEASRGLFYSPTEAKEPLLFHLEGADCLLSAGAPDRPVAHRTLCLQRPLNHMIGGLPFWVGTRLSGGTSDCPVLPLDRCRGDVVGVDRAVDRWHGVEPLVAWRIGHVRCTLDCLVIFSQCAVTFSREQLVGQLNRPGLVHTGLSGEAQSSPCLVLFSQTSSLLFGST
jgi:hypothetical protein